MLVLLDANYYKCVTDGLAKFVAGLFKPAHILG